MPRIQNIDTVRAILDPLSNIHCRLVTDDFYQSLDEFGDFIGHSLISQFAFDEPWPTWEIHPAGDELVLLQSGDTDLVLANDDGSETVMRLTQAGDYVVIPRGTWHTARPHEPTSMLFITPGAGTLNAHEPGGEPV